MPKLYHSVLQLPDGIEKNRRYLIEARTRALPGVESAFAGDNGSFSIYFRDPEVLKLLPALLGRESRSVSRRPSREPESDPEAEARICKINALISLGGFALLEAVKRSFPVLFGKISLIRSAFVILISKEIIRNGASGLIREHSPNADTLTATAVIASILAGKPESSLSLLVLSNFAEMLSLSAAEKARKHISHLLGLKEKFIWKIVNGTVAKVRIDDVKAGDQVAVYLGEKISVDGVVISGSASVDQSSLTGEFVPVYKVPGDTVFAGTVVQSGQLVIEAHRVGDDTNLSRIVHMVENAQNRRAPVQNFADRLASMLVPISFIAAGLVYVTTKDVQRVLNMFFIDYSCGLRLSTATAISAAISRSAQIGVLVKGGNFIEHLSDVDTVILDKTGTITAGHPVVTGIITAPDADEEELVMLSAAAERNSSHPLSESILSYAEKRNITIPKNARTEAVVGRGIRASLSLPGGETSVLVGSRTFMDENRISGLSGLTIPEGAWNVFYVAKNGRIMGAVLIADPIRKDLKRAINRLRREGIDEILMLTGDSKQNAEAVTRQLDLDGYQSNMLPQDKANFIAGKQRGSRVLMVGDGINDAPALAYADIGVAMGGKSTDIALESADITITSDEPLKLPEVLKLSRRTMYLVRQNFAITIAVNSAALLLGALGKINPLLAATIHNASTVAVVLNSSRLLFEKMNIQKPRSSGEPLETDRQGPRF
ncbi:heavy metal translocating P-type ATPase [Succinimonas amylolytica]|uniref:heavy metal translocating P-type ATPase n=1 Tax=Succinimonas amylolytica TaxID=83769 RepID=UPI0003623CAA|nr:cation-translocating P-type ATPase [Succinimonas amylolytica]